MKQAGGVTGVDIISVSVTGVGPRTQQLDEVLPPLTPPPPGSLDLLQLLVPQEQAAGTTNDGMRFI